MLGQEEPAPSEASARTASVSAGVEIIDDLAAAASDSAVGAMDGAELGALALDIARRTGRVTNMMLREMVPTMDSGEAREVFNRLVAQGRLERRGTRRGTHYVIPSGAWERASRRGEKSVLRRLLDRRG
jgi:hypothetical protein